MSAGWRNRCCIILCCVSAEVSAQEVDPEAGIQRLLSGDRSIIPTLVEQREVVLPILVARTLPSDIDLQPLLLQLGAESYRDRIEAVKTLSEMDVNIREKVLAFQREQAGDPEIRRRTDEVVRSLQVRETQIPHATLVQYLIACGDVDSDTLLALQHSYAVVFEQKPAELFEGLKQEEVPKTFRIFAAQIMQVPKLRKPFMEWMLTSTNRNAPTLEIMRDLLKADFNSTFTAIPVQNHHHRNINRLIDTEFQDALTDDLIEYRLKQLYDLTPGDMPFAFREGQPITPTMAFHFLNSEEMTLLDHRYTSFLLGKLAALPDQDLKTLITRTTLTMRLFRILVEHKPEAWRELTGLVQSRVKNAKNYLEFYSNVQLAVDTFELEYEEGELDPTWTRLLRESDQDKDTRHLLYTGHTYHISRPVLLSHLTWHRDLFAQSKMNKYDLLVYLLESENPRIREGTLNVMLDVLPKGRSKMNPDRPDTPDPRMEGRITPLMMLREPEENKIDTHTIRRLWNAILQYPEHKHPELAAKKLEVLAHIPDAEDVPFEFSQLKHHSSALLPHRLAHFYSVNRHLMDPWLQEEELTPFGLQLLCLLSETEGLPDDTKNILRSSLSRSLKRKPFSRKMLFALHTTSLRLGGIPQEDFNALLEDVQDKKRLYHFSNLPIWSLSSADRHLLPVLEEQLESCTQNRSVLLKIGLRIDPAHPPLQKLIQDELHHADVYAVARLAIHPEVHYTALPEERLREILDVSDSSNRSAVRQLIQSLVEEPHPEIALNILKPVVGELLDRTQAHHMLKPYVIQKRTAWEVWGEDLLHLAKAGTREQAINVANVMESMIWIPSSAVPSILEVLQGLGENPMARDQMLLVVGRFAQPDPKAYHAVKALKMDHVRSKWIQVYALAALCPERKERQRYFEALTSSHEEIPGDLYIQMIAGLNGFEPQRWKILMECTDHILQGGDRRFRPHHLHTIIQESPRFQDSKRPLSLYQNLLSRFARVPPELDHSISYSQKMLENLLTHYPGELAKFAPLVEALPSKPKQSFTYHRFRSQLQERKE